MHFEILVEDQSGKKALDILVPKIIGHEHTCRIIAYKGIGHIPKNLNHDPDPKKRILLDRLPKLLQGYGKTYVHQSHYYPLTVIVVCDLDNKCLKRFRRELSAILDACDPKPDTRFCFAIEEGEAWLLGDIPAIKQAYPRAKDTILNGYQNDSICGTWEVLADAIFSGGSRALAHQEWQKIGAEKSVWAEKICPHMNIENNASPSFCYFRTKIRELVRTR
jgi:hypothetical protein